MIPKWAEETIVGLVAAVMQGVIRRAIDQVLQWSILEPSRHNFKVAVTYAIHDVEENEVYVHDLVGKMPAPRWNQYWKREDCQVTDHLKERVRCT